MRRALIPSNAGSGMLSDFRQEVDDLFNQFFGDTQQQELARWTPRLNVSETDGHYEVSVDAPGMKPDDFNIEIRHGDLWISGERKSEHEEKGKTWHRVERSYGRFQRAIHLGDDVNPEEVDAEYRDGVLFVKVAKSEKARTKKISVKG